MPSTIERFDKRSNTRVGKVALGVLLLTMPSLSHAKTMAKEAVRITPEEAERHGLPAIGFTVTVPRLFVQRALPGGSLFLSLNGPPGGTLSVAFHGFAGEGPSASSLASLVSPSHGARARVVSPARVRVAGAERDAAAFEGGEAMAAATHCAIVIERRTKKGTASVIIVASRGGLVHTCEKVLEEPSIHAVVAGLRFR